MEPINRHIASEISELDFDDLSAQVAPSTLQGDLNLISQIPVQLSVELGRTKVTARRILQFTQGSIIELDGLAGEPMDVLINGCLIAHGEVVVVNEKFGIRFTDISDPSARRKISND